MKKLIASIVIGGGTLFALANGTLFDGNSGPAATSLEVEPCPSCCPPEICNFNGPSFDGTRKPSPVEHLNRDGSITGAGMGPETRLARQIGDAATIEAASQRRSRDASPRVDGRALDGHLVDR